MADEKEKTKSEEPGSEQKIHEAAQGNRGTSFPVIGIGASAGGLEALGKLFENTPSDTGAAYVVVQHLAPTKQSAMPELLKRYSQMAVHQVTNNVPIEPDSIYLIPPGKNMSVVDGTLHLLDKSQSEGISHPIDFFFKSLASDRGARAVAIILSGTGTDGTEGARLVKAELGLVIAQDPNEAQYGGMPQSAIDAGLADYVLAAADIPARITMYIENLPYAGDVSGDGSNGLLGLLPKYVALIRNETGSDFSAYKEGTLLRRIGRRMAVHHVSDPVEYLRFLQQDSKEVNTLFKELLINVTSFFRDKDAFEALKSALRIMVEAKTSGEEIRIWVVGCATGEEPYSIAILIREILEELEKDNNVQIFATDLDSDAIREARSGKFRSNIADDITPERLKRFFTKVEDTYQVTQEIRGMIVFAAHNVAKEPPFLRTDLISARNLLIYLKGDLQRSLIPVFHYSLRENGLLFLSPSESVGEYTDLFEDVDRKWKLYKRRLSGRNTHFPPSMFHPAHVASAPPQPAQGRGESDFLQLTDKILLSDYAPPYVVIDQADNVVFVRGNVSKYLSLPEGNITTNLLQLARRDLTNHLSIAIRTARKNKAEVRREGVKQIAPDDSTLDLMIRPFPAQGKSGEHLGEHLMVIFKEEGAHLLRTVGFENKAKRSAGGKKQSEKDRYIAELEQELKHSREDLQTIVEELETSNEELKSSNEELLSSNEELQSSNEELETSREELRSVNEELRTLNEENQGKIEQLNRTKDDMHNLLNSINVAAVFLDMGLNVKGFTPAATQLFSIRENDINRPIHEIKSALEYDTLEEDVRKVLDTLIRIERQVKIRDGHWFLMRILPYRSNANEIRGAALTFLDINQQRVLETALHYTQAIVDTVREPMLILDSEQKVVSANRSFFQVFRVSPEETLGKTVYELGGRQWDIPMLKKLLEEIIPKDKHFDSYPVEHDFPFIGRRKIILNARRFYDEFESPRILLAFEDITGKPSVDELFPSHEPKEKGRKE